MPDLKQHEDIGRRILEQSASGQQRMASGNVGALGVGKALAAPDAADAAMLRYATPLPPPPLMISCR